MVDETDPESGILELPSVDGRGTLLDPLEHPPDEAEVGADLRAAATSRQEAPTVDTFEGRLLKTFVSGEIDQVIKILSQAESQSIDLRNVSDADGKTLLHLACRKGGVDWESIVRSLVEKHHCDVAAEDEDGNTPLREAYQCGNLQLVAYLLRLPTCNPDAINKQDYTVLRMALEVNDKTTARDLLATGRVDPRKGSSRGHTYQELLVMNQLQPQPQDYDGSALQMVTQFAECMEGNNHVRPPFTSYCLRDTLHKILKNCGQVSITGIVDRIKDKMLPLPANPDEIHELLIDIQNRSNEFDICGEDTNEFGEIKVRSKGYENNPESLLRPFPMPPSADTADEPDSGIPTMDDRGNPLENLSDDTEEGAPGALRAAATSPQEALTVDSFGRRMLQFFRSGEFEQVIEILSQAESQSIDLRSVSDADGKTLLHLACKNWVDWHDIVCSLVEKHHCNVAAEDEDGNTPLHEAYQCGNLLSVAYLLSLPTCNPDTINKHDYTVLRMALEVNDKPTVRKLLATGRVDPRKGSPRGHTYQELLVMNQLQPQPQDYDGSALQMVTQFAECMEGNNHVRQPFTSYCLLKLLHNILKNHDQVSIGGIVDHIKENTLPLPAKPDEIRDLLIDIQSLSDMFDIRRERTNDYQVRRKDKPAPSRTSEVPAPAIDDPSNDIEDGTPGYDTNTSDSDSAPILPRSPNEESVALCKPSWRCYLIGTILLVFVIPAFLIIVGQLSALLYAGYSNSLIGTVSVAQIHRQSVPLFGTVDSNVDSVKLTEIIGPDFIPISVYDGHCSSDDSFVDVEINETVVVNFGPTDKSKAVTELYLARNTTISLDITTEGIPSTDSCIAFLLVYDNFSNYINFISNSSRENFYHKECIVNETFQAKNLTFDKPSYYYIGVYTDIPAEVTTFSLHFLGTYLQYDIPNKNAGCSIDSIDALSCEFFPNTNSMSQKICIVGVVPSTTSLGIKGSTVHLYTAAVSATKVYIYFNLPIITYVFIILVIVISIYCYLHYR